MEAALDENIHVEILHSSSIKREISTDTFSLHSYFLDTLKVLFRNLKKAA
jgi:hypothetical protein